MSHPVRATFDGVALLAWLGSIVGTWLADHGTMLAAYASAMAGTYYAVQLVILIVRRDK